MQDMLKRCSLVALLTIVGLVYAGCNNSSGETKKEDAKSTPLVQFNGGTISVEEIKALLEKMPPQEKAFYQGAEGMKKLVDNLGDNAVIAQAARDEGLDKSADMQTILKIRTNITLAQEYFEKKLKPEAEKITITDEELKKYYDDNKSQFDKSQVMASHILVKDEAEAKAIYDKVKADPKSFAAIAKEKSLDPGSGEKGGDLGWFGRGRMVPEFETLAFSLAKGEIGPPVQSRFGWHIIYVTDKTETGLQPFEEVKEQIQGTLKEQKNKEFIEKAIADLKTKYAVKVDDKKLAEMAAEAPAPVSPHGGMGGAMPANPHGGTPPPPPPAPKQQ